MPSDGERGDFVDWVVVRKPSCPYLLQPQAYIWQASLVGWQSDFSSGCSYFAIEFDSKSATVVLSNVLLKFGSFSFVETYCTIDESSYEFLDLSKSSVRKLFLNCLVGFS